MHALHVAAGNLFGGVERVARRDRDRRRRVAGRTSLRSPTTAVSSEELTERGATVHSLGEVRFSRPITLWRARRRLARLTPTSTYDAVVCHSPWAYALAAPASGGRRRILWAHNALDGSHWTERRASRVPPDLVDLQQRVHLSAVAGLARSVPRTVVYPPVACGANAPGIRHETMRRARRRCQRHDGHRDGQPLRAAWKGQSTLLEAAADVGRRVDRWIAGGVQRTSEERSRAGAAWRSCVRAGSSDACGFSANDAMCPRSCGAPTFSASPTLRRSPSGSRSSRRCMPAFRW